ncbi:unnamed protein product [Adineta steineri]|uniref:Inositol polyphosphate-related phosphatase domain-containing protein n=1 Tax=Adineta steineri TaxID=433720 RepID=A0A814YHJ0_9BILA|nr:unnamed protein product [Adineta steineri]
MTESNSSSPLSILIGSFNINKRYPPSDINLSSWLTYPSITPHIVAIGLQELPLTFTFSQQKSVYEWTQLLERTLPNYQLLSHVRLNGIILFIYIQSSHINQCSSIATAKLPTVNFFKTKIIKTKFLFKGFMNIYGNKGSVGIRCELNQTSLCFLNCHLSAGENSYALQLRNQQYSLIHQHMLFKSQCKKFQWNINEHNGIFLFGDLNYRQTETNQDELQEKTDILKTYSEFKIQFPPTYKYKPNTNSYDLSRRSSWTDRVLYRNNHCRIQSINYWTTSMIRFSDHRPIAKLFFLSRLIH